MTGSKPETSARTQFVGWAFVAVQAALLVGLVVMPGAHHWRSVRALDVVGQALVLVGLLFVAFAALGLGRSLTPTPVPKDTAELQTTGLYAYVRHPIYSGVLVIVVGLVVGSENIWKLALGLFTIVFFNVKARWEESRLAERYPTYSEYCANTPRFVPLRRHARQTRDATNGAQDQPPSR